MATKEPKALGSSYDWMAQDWSDSMTLGDDLEPIEIGEPADDGDRVPVKSRRRYWVEGFVRAQPFTSTVKADSIYTVWAYFEALCVRDMTVTRAR